MKHRGTLFGGRGFVKQSCRAIVGFQYTKPPLPDARALPAIWLTVKMSHDNIFYTLDHCYSLSFDLNPRILD